MAAYDESILIENIKRLMEQNNQSQQALAKLIHMNQSSISKILKNQQKLTIENLFLIADSFGVTIDSLFKKAEETDTESVPDLLISPENIHPYEICACLATIFKSCYLNTTLVPYKETVYMEEKDEYGEGIGRYYPIHDKENNYTSIFFSNYSEIDRTADSFEEHEEYLFILEECGNSHTYNININQFLTKLADLLETYRKGSLNYESYIHAIDQNLAEVKRS